MTRRLLARVLIASLAAQPGFATATDISNVPLASASGATVLPNLLFTLDASGSMAWDFLPDYVNPSTSGLADNPCMTSSGGGTGCSIGDPPYSAGGQHALNGVAYDPDLTYRSGLNSDGTPVLSSISTNAVPNDAYGASSTSTTDITGGLTDRQYCNSNGVCLRNGAWGASTVVSGITVPAGTVLPQTQDPYGNTLQAGQFPYRANPSNASDPNVVSFGKPEMLPIGSFSGNGSSVTVTTVGPHGLTTSDKVYVTGTSNVNVNCASITATTIAGVSGATANTFTYSSSGSATNASGSYRKCVQVSTGGGTGFSRNSGVVTVQMATPHGLLTGDKITVVTGNTNIDATNVSITVSNTTAFTYAVSGSTNVTTPISGSWVRTALYNVASSVSGMPAISYYITPTEWCADPTLVTCVRVTPPAGPPAGYPFPAYVRFCQSQALALAPATAISGNDASGHPLCLGKYVNTGVIAGVSYRYPRYGWFTRDTIMNPLSAGGSNSYANRPDRTDSGCSGGTCTYSAEILNYAKWFTYYRTRIQMMKTAAGRAFLTFVSNPPAKPDILRAGFITINPFYTNASGGGSLQSTVQSSRYLRIDTFNTTQASNFYSKFYSQIPGQATPLRTALSRAGWIFAGKLNTGITAGIPVNDDPMQASCQRNFLLMTTDGFWNTGDGVDIAGNTIQNVDNVNPTIVSPYTQVMVDRATTVTYDGIGASDSTSTSSTTTEQVICSGKNNTNFATTNGAQTKCGCSNTQQRVEQAVTTTTVTTTSVEGAAPTTSTSSSSTFSNVTACSSTALSSANYTINPNPQTTSGTQSASPTPGGTADTLADAALYYYQTDLRGGKDIYGNATGPSMNLGGTGTVDVSQNNLNPAGHDFVTAQHMVTYTVGMADGLMRYQSDYPSASTGNFADIRAGTLGACFWTPGFCDWPAPASDQPSALDDLWHAAVNGRGQFYQALNANALASGLTNALNNLNTQVASAAAAATSAPNLTPLNNQAFSTLYETTTWSGRFFMQTLDPATAQVNSAPVWQADTQLMNLVQSPSTPGATTSRNIFTADPTSSTGLKAFTWSTLSSQEQGYFTNMCANSLLSQCGQINPADLSAGSLDNGVALLDYLRGWKANEAQTDFSPNCAIGSLGCWFRERIFTDLSTTPPKPSPTVLGDMVDSKPVFVGAPTESYGDPVTPSYSTFQTTNANRAPRVFIGANDGYLHAFDGNTGTEAWAYAPRFLLPFMYHLADIAYPAPGGHRYYVDGSLVTGDVFDTTNSAWKTIVVGGTGAGGNGFFALDVTDPNNPKGLWEFCNDSTLCSHSDPDLGLSYGNPVIGKRAVDGRWVVVVTSGLNNGSTNSPNAGTGGGFFYVLDAITGQLLNKVATNGSSGVNVGTAATPSGLMKIAAFYNQPLTDATFQYVYGGDQLGNVWRLDLGASKPVVTHVATLMDAPTGSSPAPRAQPITTPPILTFINSQRVLYVGTGRYLGASDLSDPGAASGIAWQQSLYAFKDKNSDYGDIRNDTNMVQQQLTQLSPTTRGVVGTPVNWTSQDGWWINFNPTFPSDPPAGDSPGERLVIKIDLVLGTLVVTTTVPNISGSVSCTSGGYSIQYNLDFKSGLPIAGATVAGTNLGQLVVGTTTVETTTGQIYELNKFLSGSFTPGSVSINTSGTGVKRFSYRVF